ncbi:MAG: tryptophan halogenase family protein [Pseudomonadota bacterium]
MTGHNGDQAAPPKRIVIVGGGTAGWMAATLMAHAWGEAAKGDRATTITLLESKTIGIIGVGEGSTPKMRRFFDRIGMTEADWMPHCNATYKCGIRFPDWCTRRGYESYYHPFFSLKDEETIRAFFHNLSLRNRNIEAPAHPDAYFVSHFLADGRRAPTPSAASGDYETDYAYHFDAQLIGQVLKDKAMALGVRHVEDTVGAVHRGEDGGIEALETEAHGRLEGDFFVDCTGFASVLLQRSLGVPFRSYADLLFNDRAVAVPTPPEADGSLPSETVSTALSAGWVWKIPLQNRFGNGYVYSSHYLDEGEAEAELRAHLGLGPDEGGEARHLKMRVGRVDAPWAENCLGVGLSQGFVEPLEATALMIVQDTVENFIDAFEKGGFTPAHRDAFNARVNGIFDGVRDYIVMHYKLNSRSDSRYWIDNRENQQTPETVASILGVWKKGGDLLAELQRLSGSLVYSPTSWFCILAGMGQLPRKPRKPKRNMQVIDREKVAAHCRRLAGTFPDHRAALEAMRPEAAAEAAPLGAAVPAE